MGEDGGRKGGLCVCVCVCVSGGGLTLHRPQREKVDPRGREMDCDISLTKGKGLSETQNIEDKR